MASIKDLLSPMDDQSTSAMGGEGLREGHSGLPSTPHGFVVTETTHFTIEFILDTICPHCYIGLRSLNTAIEVYRKRHPEATFEVTCSPMILNPHAARSGKFLIISYSLAALQLVVRLSGQIGAWKTASLPQAWCSIDSGLALTPLINS